MAYRVHPRFEEFCKQDTIQPESGITSECRHSEVVKKESLCGSNRSPVSPQPTFYLSNAERMSRTSLPRSSVPSCGLAYSNKKKVTGIVHGT